MSSNGDPIGDLYSTEQVADALGISTRRVRALARSRALGKRVGNRTWVFRQTDIESLRVRPPGRPRSDPSPSTLALGR